MAVQGESQKLLPNYYISYKGSGSVNLHQNPVQSPTARMVQRKRIIIVVDKSTSITDQQNKVSIASLRELLRLINECDGELIITTLGVSSKRYLEAYRSVSDGIIKSTSKLEGETPQQFRERIMQWKNSRKPKTEVDIDDFLNHPRVQWMLDYQHLENGSDVTGGVDMAVRYLNESDPELKYAENIAILVTDGQDKRRKYRVPNFINGQVYVVHRSENIGILKEIVPSSQIHHSFDAVVRRIVHNTKY